MIDPALRDHLIRYGAICVVWIVMVLPMFARGPAWRSFAGMTTAWAVIGLVIVAFGLRGEAVPRAELVRFLWINQGLNLGYMLVGCGVMRRWGARSEGAWAAGLAVIFQGLTLFILDGVLIARLR